MDQTFNDFTFILTIFFQSTRSTIQKERIQALHAPDVMANTKFGEWRAEERDHEPTTFEKENPDILMCPSVSEVLKNM